MIQTEDTYFASMNTTKGFFSCFSEIFNPTKLNKIYILKGGPGTGKSSFMNKVAKIAVDRGIQVERFLCSSDPSSLDAIILSEQKIAILDGTAPHTTDPDYPGVVETIINLGDFWDSTKLIENKKKILEIIREKKRLYKRAFQFLTACGEINNDVSTFMQSCLNHEKMQRNILIQASHFFIKGDAGTKECRNVSTISKFGITTLDTFENKAKRVWVIEDHILSAYAYLEALEKQSVEQNQAFYVSYSPLFPQKPNAMYFPNSKTAFIIRKRDYDVEKKGKEYHYINMKRFLDANVLSQGKQKIKFTNKCANELLIEAVAALREASELHKDLEQFYISSMNFEKMNVETDKIVAAISGIVTE